MLKRSRRGWVHLGLAGAVVLGLIGSSSAQERKEKTHGLTELNQSLRETINVGAKLYNEYGDHAGCYRVYQGALLAVKPFLPPELQQKVDASLAKAERLNTFADRAFELRAAIDTIRERTKSAEPPAAEKTNQPKKAPEPEGALETKGGQRVQLSGHVRYEGKPVSQGYFVGLVSKDGRHYTAKVQKGGAFQFHTSLPAGQYGIQIETFLEKEAPANLPPLPPRYRKAETSGVVVDLGPGARDVDINLVK